MRMVDLLFSIRVGGVGLGGLRNKAVNLNFKRREGGHSGGQRPRVRGATSNYAY